MATVVDSNSEGGFVFASLMEFMKAWESGANSRLFLESVNGSAFVSFGCFLGQPSEKHFKPKKKEKSKKKQERDNMRAAKFQAAMNENDPPKENENDDKIEECDTTRDEDFEDFTEEIVQSTVEVWSPGAHPTDEMFLNEIVPELKTSVVKRVQFMEGAASFPEPDFRVDDVLWHHVDDDIYNGVARFSVMLRYSQKMKKTREPFGDAFKRHLNVPDREKMYNLGEDKKFRKNGKVFVLKKCVRIRPSED